MKQYTQRLGEQHLAHLQEREDAGLSDWDRFARAEYVRLALEEEGDAEDGDTKILDEPWCAPLPAFRMIDNTLNQVSKACRSGVADPLHKGSARLQTASDEQAVNSCTVTAA